MRNWDRKVKASCLVDNSSWILYSCIQQNSLGVPNIPGTVQGSAAVDSTLALRSPQSRSQGSHVKSLVILTSSCRKTHCCKGKVCRDIPWHVKLVWAGSVLQYNVAFLNLASTEGPPTSGLHSNALLWAPTPSLTTTLLLFMFFFSNTYFSFFTIFPPFFCVNYRRQVQPEARSSVCRGSRLE